MTINPSQIDAGQFFQLLYGDDAPGWLVLCTIDKGIIQTIAGKAENTQGAGNKAMELAAEHNVYFGIGLQAHKPPVKIVNGRQVQSRGEADTVCAIPGLWLDIDIAGPAHKATDLPPSMDAVHELLGRLPLQPTIMVHSGNGVHVWWLFKELWTFESSAERKYAIELARRFQGTFITWAKERGWKVDNTSDLARVLRPPGTQNHKSTPPKPVTVLAYNEDARYNADEFEQYLLEIEAPVTPTKNELPADYPPADITPIATGCAWLRHCREDAAKLPEPEWYAMLSILGRCKDAETLACEWSKDYPGFSMRHTLAKLDQAVAASGPRTCEDIRAKGGAEYCDKCPHKNKITSPIVLGLPKQPKLQNPDNLPEIDAGDLDLPRVVAQAWDAVIAANEPPTLFQRGGMITRIQIGDHGEPYLSTLNEDGVRGHLARVAKWFRWQSRGKEWEKAPALPPQYVVKDMRSASKLPLPIIARVVEAPVFGADGSIETKPGYHEASRTYFWESGLQVPDVPSVPDTADVNRAKALLCEELLGDFPFASQSELAHALAALLLPFARELVNGPTPLHMIEAPSPGTGKSLLTDAIAIPSTGRPAATMTEGRDEDEWRKRLTATLLAAPTIVTIDNVRRKLDSAALSAALTSQSWKDRILGASSMTTLSVRCVWLATANNPALTTEIARRIVRIRLDAKIARPWMREGFRHNDLRSWAFAHRDELVWAALTLIQVWVAAGMPAGRYVLGQYEAWAHVMGGILDCAGVTGFLGNTAELYEVADEETEQWEQFINAWYDYWQSNPVSIRDLYAMAYDQDLLLIVRGDGSEASQKTRMGKAMKQVRDRIIGGLRVEQAGKNARSNTAMYCLTPAMNEAAATSDIESPFV